MMCALNISGKMHDMCIANRPMTTNKKVFFSDHMSNACSTSMCRQTETHTHTATYIDVGCLNGPLCLKSIPRQLRRPFALKCDARDQYNLRRIDTQPVVPNYLTDTSAPMS